MSKTSFGQYELQELLSDHPPVQAWRAHNRTTNQACLVKVFSLNGDSGGSAPLADVVARSYQHQSKIRNPDIVTALSQFRENGTLLTEYPYLDPNSWRVLTPALLHHHCTTILPFIGLIVDYLHELGLVHGDLKIENFLARIVGDHVSLCLIDMDFLSEHNSRPRGVMFGTPEYIAPEITSNNRVLTQSDLYSLGISLKRALEHTDVTWPRINNSFSREGLESFVGHMTKHDPWDRPDSILAALEEYRLIDSAQASQFKWSLLTKVAMTRLNAEGRASMRGELRYWVTSGIRVFGVPNEVIDATSIVCARSASVVLKALRELPEHCTLRRNRVHWELQFSDDDMLWLLSNIDEVAGAVGPPPSPTVSEMMTFVQMLDDNKRPLYAFLLLQRFGESLSIERKKEDPQVTQNIQIKLGKLAVRLSRHKAALGYLSAVLPHLGGPKYFEIANEAGVAAVRGKMYDEARRIVADMRRRPDFDEDSANGLRCDRIEAWLFQVTGKYAEAEEMLSQLLSRAERLKEPELTVTIAYMIGTLALLRGDLLSARSKLDYAIDLAQEHHILVKAVPVLSVLASVEAELGDYERSLSHGKLAFRLGQARELLSAGAAGCLSAVVATVRLAEFRKSDFWHEKYSETWAADPQTHSDACYQALTGFVRLQQGKFAEAEAAFLATLSRSSRREEERFALKAHQGLAELALWQGDDVACLDHVRQGRVLAQSIPDRNSNLELELIAILSTYVYDPASSPVGLSEVADRLTLANCRYYAMLAAYHLLLRGMPLPESVWSLIRELHRMRSSQRVPLFSAVFRLSIYSIETDHAHKSAEVSALKQAYRELEAGRQVFLAGLTAIKIADRSADYREEFPGFNHARLAQRHLAQADEIARRLSNQKLHTTIASQIEQLPQVINIQEPLIAAFRAVEPLLKDVRDYQETLARIVQFSVVQTAAERGILFLKSPDKPGLHIAASFNCDDASIKEMKEFSVNILASIKDDNPRPLFIENALDDSRTNKFQSVIRHNIQSVACLPLVKDRKLIGILYLDHHGIAGLFTEEDHKFLEAISSFLMFAVDMAKEMHLLRSKVVSRASGSIRFGKREFIGEDQAVKTMLSGLMRIAGTSMSVLLRGESGTGKDVLSEAVHYNSPRSKGPFVILNSAGLSEELADSAVFGHVKGAFTSAISDREGKLELADGGTFFLDEIADMPLGTQARFLRILEDPVFERLGGNRKIHSDVRFVFATNRNLEQLIKEGKFRDDLYRRIIGAVIHIPPLRDRLGDVPILLEYFIKQLAVDGLPPRFSQESMQVLLNQQWPGNVRQLRQIVEYCCELYPGELITPAKLPSHLLDKPVTPDSQIWTPEEETERVLILDALIAHDWNSSRAARSIGMSLRTFIRRCRKYDLWRPR